MEERTEQACRTESRPLPLEGPQAGDSGAYRWPLQTLRPALPRDPEQRPAGATMAEAPRRTNTKLPRYNGENPLETYLVQVRLAANLNGWSGGVGTGGEGPTGTGQPAPQRRICDITNASRASSRGAQSECSCTEAPSKTKAKTNIASCPVCSPQRSARNPSALDLQPTSQPAATESGHATLHRDETSPTGAVFAQL